jgi:hypothetical protein
MLQPPETPLMLQIQLRELLWLLKKRQNLIKIPVRAERKADWAKLN